MDGLVYQTDFWLFVHLCYDDYFTLVVIVHIWAN